MFKIQDVAYENVESISIGSLYDTFNRDGGFSFYFTDFRSGSAYLWINHHNCDCNFIFPTWRKIITWSGDWGNFALEIAWIGFCFYLLGFPFIGANGKTCAWTFAGSTVVLGLSVYVLFAIDSTIVNCIYLCCKRERGSSCMQCLIFKPDRYVYYSDFGEHIYFRSI